LTQHHTDHSKKADQLVQIDNRDAGKKKGFVDSVPPGKELQADRGKAVNPDPIQSNLDNLVIPGPPTSQALQADPAMTFNPDTIHSELDDVATPGLPPGLEVNFNHGESFPKSWPVKVAPETIVPDADETPATTLPHRIEKYRPKKLPPSYSELDDDEAGWKFVPYFGAALLFFSWIVQSGLGAIKLKAAKFKFEPNALPSIGSINGPRRFTVEDGSKPSGPQPPALDEFAAASSVAGERQQKAAEEKPQALLEHFSGDPDFERAKAEREHAHEIKETFRKDFDGIGLS
jgi:hypothetical protein